MRLIGRRRPTPEAAASSLSTPRLPGADRAWRPAPWVDGGLPASPGNGADLAEGVRLFHDAASGAVTLSSGPAHAERPHPLELRQEGFDGGFLSLAIALPQPFIEGLDRHHLLGIDVDFGAAGLPRAFARLNLRQGPNLEKMLRGLPETGPTGTEFDLWALETDPGRVEAGWIDLIFEAPLPSVIAINDLVIARRFRAQF
ncbi:DUF6478 family protein [Limimaricola variabilis]|uniref:DUF6478 family protein n=1 Tax=Limimaricola variabilis TaxID=1492771 RepID=UPI002AC9D135|nr:DUF6478 family protein [Limimaricola variabilis]WPY93525.1 DUF6478 family protein [Limimaricola variabilis]